MSGERESIFLYGAGGHARSVAEVIRREGRYEIAAVLDDGRTGSVPGVGEILGGVDLLGSLQGRGIRAGFVAIGLNRDREALIRRVEEHGLRLISPVDPAAVVAQGVTVGPGSVLMPFCLAGAGSVVGRGVIINTSATVDHDCVIADFVHISVGVHFGGACHVGERSFIGIGAVVGNNIRLGADVTIGASSTVIADVDDGTFVAGIPARPRTPSTGPRTPERGDQP